MKDATTDMHSQRGQTLHNDASDGHVPVSPPAATTAQEERSAGFITADPVAGRMQSVSRAMEIMNQIIERINATPSTPYKPAQAAS